MKTIFVKLPNKKKKISIIRSERKILKELEKKKTKGNNNAKLQDQPPVVFIEKFVIANYNVPLQIDLNTVKQDTLEMEIVKEEVQKAYDKGFEDGMVSTKASFTTEFEKYQGWIKRFDLLSDKLHQKYKEKVKELEDSILSLAIMVSEHIINKEIEADKNIVISQVREAIASIEDELVFKIRVNPEDKEILNSVKSDLLNDKEKAEKLNIISDNLIEPGSCILETSAGTIDATIKTRLEKISISLADAVKSEEEQRPVHKDYDDEDLAFDMNEEVENDEDIQIEEGVETDIFAPGEKFENRKESSDDIIIIPDEESDEEQGSENDKS